MFFDMPSDFLRLDKLLQEFRAEEQGIAIHRLTPEVVESMAKPDAPFFWPGGLFPAVARIVNAAFATLIRSVPHPQRLQLFATMLPQIRDRLSRRVFFAVRDNKTVVGVSPVDAVILKPSMVLEAIGKVPGRSVMVQVEGSPEETVTVLAQTGRNTSSFRGIKLELALNSAWTVKRCPTQLGRNMASLRDLPVKQYRLANNQQAIFLIRSALNIKPD